MTADSFQPPAELDGWEKSPIVANRRLEPLGSSKTTGNLQKFHPIHQPHSHVLNQQTLNKSHYLLMKKHALEPTEM